MMRNYTVHGIDELRRAVEDRYDFGTSAMFTGMRMGRSYMPNERTVSVEEQIRTYMLAGVTGSDLREADTQQAVTNADRDSPSTSTT